jgi:hypothetical protein
VHRFVDGKYFEELETRLISLQAMGCRHAQWQPVSTIEEFLDARGVRQNARRAQRGKMIAIRAFAATQVGLKRKIDWKLAVSDTN